MWDGATRLDIGQAFLDLLLHVQLVHDVVPGGLVRQVLDDLPGGVFGT